MGQAFLWGLVAASSLVIGGLIALRFRIGDRPLGLVMGFGAGVLISAVAYELLISAVFLSNLPEAIAATAGLKAGGWPDARVTGLWVLVAVIRGFASLLGYVALSDAPPATLGFVEAFAAGAVLTMLADAMMPEASRHGGRAVGLMTTAGFVVSTALTTMD